MLRLNIKGNLIFDTQTTNSNTTNVKVKRYLLVQTAMARLYSNTTNVKVKPKIKQIYTKE